MKHLLLLLFAVFVPLCALCSTYQDKRQADTDTTKWYNRTHKLNEVTVSSRRQRYSRKNNPAVELMRKVIAAKRRTDLSNNDYYAFQKYQKITLSANDVTPDDLTEGMGILQNPWAHQPSGNLSAQQQAHHPAHLHGNRQSPRLSQASTCGTRRGDRRAYRRAQPTVPDR